MMEARKQAMLKSMNLTGPNPNDKYQSLAEVMEGMGKYENNNIFAQFISHLNSPEMAQYKSSTAQPRVTDVALFKTHKTGSTTLASVFFRFAARSRLKIFHYGTSTVLPKTMWPVWNERVPTASQHQFNIIFQHLSGRGDVMPASFTKALDFYRAVLTNPKVVSIVREPTTHSLSWLCFYYVPQSIAALTQAINVLPFNLLSSEFDIRKKDELDVFLSTTWNEIDLMCVSELFDECLVMLRRRFNWDMLDITYLRLLDSADIR